jgi:hypothetical protein
MADKHFLLDRKFLIVIGFLLLFGMQPAAARTASDGDPSWTLLKQSDESGNRFYLYRRDVADSGYDRYRLEAVVDEPSERVIQAIQIRGVDDQYLDEGLSRSFFRRAEGDDSLTYFRMRIPVVSDRDVTLRTKRGFEAETGVYRDEWWTANEEAPPLKEGYVRMSKSEGFWEVTPMGESRSHVVYESHADPGGRLPSWIANSMLGDQVIDQIVTLRRIIDDHRTGVAAPPPTAGASNF